MSSHLWQITRVVCDLCVLVGIWRYIKEFVCWYVFVGKFIKICAIFLILEDFQHTACANTIYGRRRKFGSHITAPRSSPQLPAAPRSLPAASPTAPRSSPQLPAAAPQQGLPHRPLNTWCLGKTTFSWFVCVNSLNIRQNVKIYDYVLKMHKKRKTCTKL